MFDNFQPKYRWRAIHVAHVSWIFVSVILWSYADTHDSIVFYILSLVSAVTCIMSWRACYLFDEAIMQNLPFVMEMTEFYRKAADHMSEHSSNLSENHRRYVVEIATLSHNLREEIADAEAREDLLLRRIKSAYFDAVLETEGDVNRTAEAWEKSNAKILYDDFLRERAQRRTVRH